MMSSSLRLWIARSLSAFGSEAIQLNDKSFARTLGFILRRLVLYRGGIESRQHAEVASHRVEHRLFVVELDPIHFAASRRRDDLGDCRRMAGGEIAGWLDFQAIL